MVSDSFRPLTVIWWIISSASRLKACIFFAIASTLVRASESSLRFFQRWIVASFLSLIWRESVKEGERVSKSVGVLCTSVILIGQLLCHRKDLINTVSRAHQVTNKIGESLLQDLKLLTDAKNNDCFCPRLSLSQCTSTCSTSRPVSSEQVTTSFSFIHLVTSSHSLLYSWSCLVSVSLLFLCEDKLTNSSNCLSSRACITKRVNSINGMYVFYIRANKFLKPVFPVRPVSRSGQWISLKNFRIQVRLVWDGRRQGPAGMFRVFSLVQEYCPHLSRTLC